MGPNSSAIVTGHFRGAGQPLDLAVLNSGGVSVLLGNADGSFQPAQEFYLGAGLVSLAVGDFNGDGKLDLLTINTGNDVSVALALGNGDGTFGPAVNVAAGLVRTPFGSALMTLIRLGGYQLAEGVAVTHRRHAGAHQPLGLPLRFERRGRQRCRRRRASRWRARRGG